jgi:hypothetical protein
MRAKIVKAPSRTIRFGDWEVAVSLPELRGPRGQVKGFRRDYVQFSLCNVRIAETCRVDVGTCGDAWNAEPDLDAQAKIEVDEAVRLFAFFRGGPDPEAVREFIAASAADLIREGA